MDPALPTRQARIPHDGLLWRIHVIACFKVIEFTSVQPRRYKSLLGMKSIGRELGHDGIILLANVPNNIHHMIYFSLSGHRGWFSYLNYMKWLAFIFFCQNKSPAERWRGGGVHITKSSYGATTYYTLVRTRPLNRQFRRLFWIAFGIRRWLWSSRIYTLSVTRSIV